MKVKTIEIDNEIFLEIPAEFNIVEDEEFEVITNENGTIIFKPVYSLIKDVVNTHRDALKDLIDL
ncbi:MAG: hypothetical protein LBN08_01970 [Lactobacillales bacterium]|jgi:hypothetical protein|nr:hypothetical protein [Lactobacillales bacterium]